MLICVEALGIEFDDRLKGQWPQWRGPNGLGISNEKNLPKTWNAAGRNIRWKTTIPGEGFSSPVVGKGKVVLTTAYESTKFVISRKFVKTTGLGLAVAFAIGTAVYVYITWQRKKQKKYPAVKHSLIERLNRPFIWIISLSFVCIELIATMKPQYFEMVFGRFDFLVSSLGGYHSNLLSMDKGAPAAIWLTSGSIALLGLAASAGWFRAQSIWTLLGSVTVFLLAPLLVIFTPLDQWKLQVDLYKRIIFTIPALLVAFWHILNCFKIQLRNKHTFTPRGTIMAPWYVIKRIEVRWRLKNIWGFGNKWALFFVLLLIALSALVFIPPNFTQTQLGIERVVVCVDMKSGNILWQQPVFVEPAERKHNENSYATPTPAVDNRHIMVNFGLGIACLDWDGNILWSKKDKHYFENSRYGAVSSPIFIDDKALIVQECEWNSKQATWIAAFEKRTRRRLWKINPMNIYGCYTTPLLYRDGAHIQLIIASRENVASYDVESGELLWTKEIPIQNMVAGMTRSGELLCIAGGTYGPKATIIMRLNGKGKDTKADVIWQSSRNAPGCSSPVIYEDKLFVVTDTGIMTCYDVNSGKVFWNNRLKGRHLSSLVAGDGRVYACNTKGLTTVIAADSEYKLLAENDLQGRCFASPAIADSCIFIRIENYLYCIEKKD
ncbi:MAG: PQQ-binding-like beta-propeller repeat protein [Phycisphaerae bacterium]|nr:PQQ-binding-like beta-propeller repeat protein [Phycisphaerae bacterium]NIV69358.1 PQQ-binding-like beta-propeller repeat protein [Phycisphaerae bacterium]NIW72652.1 PQQ-binding-like beta-propeller repeat protein [candidate division KSB1 bacterium]